MIVELLFGLVFERDASLTYTYSLSLLGQLMLKWSAVLIRGHQPFSLPEALNHDQKVIYNVL